MINELNITNDQRENDRFENVISTLRAHFGLEQSDATTLLLKLRNLKYNIDPLNILGSGAYGVAFLLKSGNVLKITEDYDEAETSSSLIGKKLKNVYHVYKVFQLKSFRKIFFIEQELLKNVNYFVEEAISNHFMYNGELASVLVYKKESNNKSQGPTIYKILFSLLSSLTESISKFESSRIDVSNLYGTTLASDISIDRVVDCVTGQRAKKLYLDMLNAARELEDNKIEFTDMNPGNIMLDNIGNFKIIDLGCRSKSPYSNIEQFENRIIKVGDLI